MSVQQSHSEIGFKRCAVCKIDLKGRFVYIDERTEHLLGLTKEDLFGKNIIEFLDEPSQKLSNSCSPSAITTRLSTISPR